MITAEQQQAIARNLTLLLAATAAIPLRRAREPFVPPNDALSSTTRCWDVRLLDQFQRARKGFLRGPDTISEATERANDLFKNWIIVSITPSLHTQPPANAGPVPPVASEFGVLKSLQNSRRR